MTRADYLTQLFLTLRREIEGQQKRVFWIIVIGLLGMPALGYFLLGSNTPIYVTMPFFLLVLIILYLTEQNHMIRVGRYIREHIESEVDFTPGWEAWLERHGELRLVDKHFSSFFIVLFFAYYFMAVVFALDRLVEKALAEPYGPGWWWVIGAAGVYGITTIWGVSTLFHHWRSLISPVRERESHKGSSSQTAD